MARPDWLVPGTKVATFARHQTMGVARPEFTTIERVLKRDVVLADGQRFRADTRERHVGGGFSTTTYALYPVGSPEVQEQVAKYNEWVIQGNAKGAAHDFYLGKASAEEAINAIARTLDKSLGDEIRALLP